MSPTQSKFETASAAQWHALVDKILKGAPIDCLNRQDEDSLLVKALYPVPPLSTAATAGSRLPIDPAAHVEFGWDICQPVDCGEATHICNHLILEALEDGVNSLWLTGLPQEDPSLLAARFDGVILPAVGVYLDSGNDAVTHMASFATLARDKGTCLSALRFGANIDPFAPDAAPDLLAAALGYLTGQDDGDIPHGLFSIGGWRWHNRGMTLVQELGYVLAGLVAVLRHAHQVGVDPEALLPRLSASLALPADMFDGIAKCRALRQCWGGIVDGLGLDPAHHRLQIQAIPSLRMYSTLDIEVNMLRGTTALLGGAVGGADQLSMLAHDCLSGDSAEGRRLARMTHHMLIEESGLAQSLDAAGGASFIESRTSEIASAAWAAFQAIEAEGGAAAVTETGVFARWAQQAAITRFARFAQGKLHLVGVNLQPENRRFTAALPRWQEVRRPAGAVEMIRLAAADAPPRLLVLQGEGETTMQMAEIRKFLSIGQMAPVLMRLADADAAAISAARPDHVILLGCDMAAFDAAVKEALAPLDAAGRVVDAEAMMADQMPLDLLAAFAQVTLDAYRTGAA